VHALLRMQLEPHFLFNTLNTISALIDWRRKLKCFSPRSGEKHLLTRPSTAMLNQKTARGTSCCEVETVPWNLIRFRPA
jgi:hypothetical protein